MTLLLLGIILLLPSIAHAESIQTTLRTNVEIKKLHVGFLEILNIPIILVIIVMAFAEMLHLKIDTYGLKKILPSLILAIVAAQFSYLICKLVLDLANMVMTLFTDPSLLGKYIDPSLYGGMSSVYNKSTTGIGDGLMAPNPDFTQFQYTTFFSYLFGIVINLVGSVIALILAFLFIVRQWMIYLLVIISSIAFMSLALPQTKTYFTKWWTEYIKWTFMPVVSLGILWIGATFLSHPIMTGTALPAPFVNAIVAILCLYYAITVPIKMGGPVMAGFLKYSGANWGIAKAKQKWVDPAIQYWKDRTLNWWHGQASGSQARLSALNPLGAIARRGLRVEEWRKAESEKTKTSKEGALRWALGGKPISEEYDEKTGKMKFKYKFFNDAGRRRFAKQLDDVKSDAGEADYIRKQLDLDWKMNTPEGQLAIGRSVAYADRVGAVDNWHKAKELDVDALSYANDDKNNWFLNNTSFGINAGDRHWKRQKDFFVRSQQKLERSSELIDTKMKNDRIKFDYQPAATLTMLKEEIEMLRKNSQSQVAGTKASKDLAVAMNRWKNAIATIKNDESLYKNGQLTSNAITLKSMLTNSQGHFVGDDVDKAQSLTKLWGYDNAPADLRELFISRLRKATSIIAKEEVTSEAGKRIPVESAKRAVDKFKKQLEDMFSGMQSGVWTNKYKDAFGALKNSLVNARDENAPVIYGMYVDMLKGIATSADAEVSDEMKQNALGILASGQTQSMRTSLQQSTIMNGVLTSAAQEELAKTGVSKKVWDGYGKDKQAEEISKLRKDKNFRIKVQDKLHDEAARITRQENDQLKKIVQIKYDEHGQVHVFADTSDTALAGELLGSMNSQAVNFNEREKSNSEGQQRLSTIAGMVSAMPTSQEAITFFENNIYSEAREKKAQKLAEDRARFDAINT